MATMYSLNIPGNPTVNISQDELRSLLAQIETELHRSKVYLRALATLQNGLGASSEQVKILFKAVGREAISLAFQQLALQPQTFADMRSQVDVAISSEEESADYKGFKSKSQPENKDNSLSSSAKEISTAAHPPLHTPEKPQSMWWGKQKSSAAEQARLAAEQRVESLCQIGKQLRQARESQGLSLNQLQVYTHIPLHHMEALENGNLDLLPEDVLIRGFIRVMGNALGLNGTNLASSLLMPQQAQSVLPSWYKAKNASGFGAWEIRPLHLYVSYTALVAGAVGGLSLVSQQTNVNRAGNSDVVIPANSSLSQSQEKTQAKVKVGASVGADIAPPESL
jgi:hypothetical protein